MSFSRMTALRLLGLTALMFAITVPAQGAGFGIFEQGTKAMGMAGAFTAQADDGSAMFHNVAGLGFQKERRFDLGVTYITAAKAEFDGANPFPGVGVHEEQESLSEFPPHFYWVQPIGEKLTFGLGLNTPFGLSTSWKDPDNFTGRYISTEAALTVINFTPNIAWQASENFSVGFGLHVYYSDVELQQRSFITNPFTGQPIEIAKSSLEGGHDEGFGFQLGILHRWNNSFSWGLMYRSAVEVDYSGDLTLTQIPTGIPPLDGLVGTLLPFNQAIGAKTSIEMPDMASLGLLFAVSPDIKIETDFNWTGWSSFDRIVAEFDTNNPLIELERAEDWDDVWNFRIGLNWQMNEKSQLRFG